MVVRCRAAACACVARIGAVERPGRSVGSGSLPIVAAAAPVAFFIATTARGDAAELLDASGAPFALYSYDAYGNPGAVLTDATARIPAALAQAIAEANALRYAGYAYDAHSGLYYLSKRYYDPAAAQFLTKDPAKADGEESPYQYCGGDPVGKVDPSGEDQEKRGIHPAKVDATRHLRDFNGHLGAMLMHLPGGKKWKPWAWRDMKEHIKKHSSLCAKDLRLLKEHLRKGQPVNTIVLASIAAKVARLARVLQDARDQVRSVGPCTTAAATAAIVVVLAAATVCPVVPPPP
ncbi:MAG: RHS repeat-associated core domain-containing protein [Coriobacteriia bacterium]|nr:RHS repeat-associated core domain-containing protein [Coriobacteriia bacterium]